MNLAIKLKGILKPEKKDNYPNLEDLIREAVEEYEDAQVLYNECHPIWEEYYFHHLKMAKARLNVLFKIARARETNAS